MSIITNSRSVTSVVVSDVSPMRCELLAKQLMRKQPGFQVVGCAITVEGLLKLAQCDPALVVVSSELCDGPLSGFQALRQLRSENSKIRAVVLLDRCEQDLVVAAFRGGARGVFCRSGSLDDLAKCLERVHEGQVWAGDTELQFVLDALSTIAPLRVPALDKALNRREDQIAELVASGTNNREIGRKLNLTEHSVAESLERILGKLGVQSRVELAMVIRQNGRPCAPCFDSSLPRSRE